MSNQAFSCPNCGKELTAAFSKQVEEKLQLDYEARTKILRKEHEQEMTVLQNAAEARLGAERARFDKEAKTRAEEAITVELNDLRSQLQQKTENLAASREQELALRRQKADLEEREGALKLEVARTIDAERARIKEAEAARLEEAHHLRDQEKDRKLSDMVEQLEKMKRQAEQGSQQSQGEVLELELEDILKTQFPFDTIEPVAKGVRGADVLQRVHSSSGHVCGSILWESKRTKDWQEKWLQKLKDDQREAKADLSIIVSTVLPKGMNRFGPIDGVWVSDFASAMGLAAALRSGIIEVSNSRSALAGKGEKMELLYKYLAGADFKRRLEPIVESFASMKDALDSEKRAMTKIWAVREKQMDRVFHSLSGMYGDLQGLVGSSMPQISQLELAEPELPEEETVEATFTGDILDQPVAALKLSSRAYNCLIVARVKTVGELVTKRETDLLAVKNFGRKSLDEIIARLSEMGLSLAPETFPGESN